MPTNTKPVQPFTENRHIDLQADLHFFFDSLFTGKRVLDVGAGLGKSKARMRHNDVTTYEPSVYCRDLVDRTTLPKAEEEMFDIVTAFEVLEHVKDDVGFLRTLDALATQAIFVTTPNWHVAQCQSADHYREYTPEEFVAVIDWLGYHDYWFWAYYKDAEGGWVDEPENFATHRGLKHAVLLNKGLSYWDEERINWFMSGRRVPR